MLRMNEFEVHTPATVAEAVALRRDLAGSMYVAGGTDLLPNLKHGLHAPAHLVSLGALSELVGIEEHDGALRIGAGTSLHAVATHPAVPPGLRAAAASVAGPQHRRMGTLGGNVMLDTRCLFYNQSEPWREALGHCLKAEGDWCHVIGSAKRCVAAHSADTVPMLMALGAVLEVEDPEQGAIELDLDALLHMDGRFEQNHTIDDRALLRAIRIPTQPAGHRSVYRKVRSRGAVDFPQLGLALVGDFDSDGVVRDLRGVFTALLPKPKPLRKLEDAVGTRLPDDVIEVLADQAFRQTHPQTNIHGDPAWRKHMARVEMRRGLQALRDGA